MPGRFGSSDNETGVLASTKATDQFGVFGSNEANSPPTGGGAGGAGVFGLSVSPGAAGVFGANNSAKGVGVQGNGPEVGVSGFSQQGAGLRGITQSSGNFGVFGSNDSSNAPSGGGAGGAGVFGLSVSPGGAGVFGANNSAKGVGVQGNGPEIGVSGFSQQGTGLRGFTQSSGNFGVFGSNDSSTAPTGGGAGGAGVFGLSVSPGGAGVFGANNSAKGVGVQGNGPEVGVSGFSREGTGVRGSSEAANGLVGFSRSGNGVEGHSADGVGIVGKGGRLAARFEGDVETTGNLIMKGGDIHLANADCAEEFAVSAAEPVEPGTVMVIDEGGRLNVSSHAYDKRVAGVVSGAGGYRPGILLDRRKSDDCRVPIALVGKVYCKVDAQNAPIELGDLLTTSHIPGFAMKAVDRSEAFGAVLGKALSSCKSGTSLIPVLIALQ